jgi:SSS family solute:Na+ symporter
VEIALLTAYALLVAASAWTPGKRTAAAFYVNGRQSGALGLGLSIIVSCVGASATIGMVGMAFHAGTPAFWWLGSGAAGLLLLSFFLAGAVRKSGAYTLPHLTESCLGPAARPLVSALVVIAWSAILAAQFTALGSLIAGLTGLPAAACLALSFFLICAHSLGGQAAVMRVDRVQAAIIFLALFILLAWLCRRNPAWPDLAALEAVNADFTASDLVYYLLVIGANYVVCPMLFGRLLSAKNERSARLGGLIGALGIVLAAALIVAVGLACRGLVPPGTPADEVLSALLAVETPRWLRLAASLALISAVVSSADSCLITAATVLSFDLLRRPAPSAGRACVLALGIGGALISLWGKGILGFLLMAYDIFACGVVMPVLVGLLQRRRRPDPRWSVAAVGLGGLLGLMAALSGVRLWSCAGMGISFGLAAIGAIISGARESAVGHECSPSLNE